MFQRDHFVWNEPWFFSWRIRHWRSWIALAVILLVVAGITAAALLFLAAKPPSWFEVTWLSIAVAAIIWLVIDGPLLRRRAVLDAKALHVLGDLGQFSRHDKYPIETIQIAVLRRADELNWPFPALFLVVAGEPEAVGVSHSISLSRLASALWEVGVPVQMEGWDPHAGDEFERTFHVEVADTERIQPTARIETLPDDEPSLWSPAGIVEAILKQCWAGAIALGVIVYFGIHLYETWGNLGLVQTVLSIIIPISVLYIAGLYTDRVATAWTSKSLIQDAIKQLSRRRGVLLNADASDLFPVDVFREDQFDKTVQKMHEMGFVQVDTQRKSLLFEGKKQRWCLPADSLKRMAIESVQSGAEGDPGAGLKNYYVVIEFETTEGSEKFGLRSSVREVGEYNDIKRAEQGIELFELILPLFETSDPG